MIKEKREYYVLKVHEGIKTAFDVCIGNKKKQRYSLNKSEVIIKTNKSKLKTKINKGFKRSDILPNKYTKPLTHFQALELMATKEWQSQEVL